MFNALLKEQPHLIFQRVEQEMAKVKARIHELRQYGSFMFPGQRKEVEDLTERLQALERIQERLPWQRGRRLRWVVGSPGVERPDPDPPIVYEPPPGDRALLDFRCPWPSPPGDQVVLAFGPAQCIWDWPRPRRFFAMNSLHVVRLPERTPIAVDAGSIEASRGNALRTCRLDLCVPADLGLLKPVDGQPKSVEINLNGHVRVFAIRAWTDSNRHPKDGGQGRRVSVTGESRAKLLDTPYAPARSRTQADTRQAVQLIDEELAGTGFDALPPGGGWGWEVPGGVWSYEGLTPLAAVRRIAEAAGAYVIAHPFEDELLIRPTYAAMPWAWASTAPDRQIQDEYILEDSGGAEPGSRDSRTVTIPLWPGTATDKPGFVEPGDLCELIQPPTTVRAVADAVRVSWSMQASGNGASALVVDQVIVLDPAPPEPLYNAVQVSGAQVGVRDTIIRDGTAGDVGLPPIVDALITQSTVARERGRQALAGSSGRAASSLWSALMGLLPGSRRIAGNIYADHGDGD